MKPYTDLPQILNVELYRVIGIVLAWLQKLSGLTRKLLVYRQSWVPRLVTV